MPMFPRKILISRPNFVRLSCFLFCLFILSLPGWQSKPSQAGGNSGGLAAALNPDGSLRAGVDGSFDMNGYRLEMTASGAPRFMATTCSGYDTQFALPNGTNGSVYAMQVKGTDIYIGGNFTAVGDINANDVAKFDTLTNTWSALSGASGGNGVDSIVTNMLFVGNELYVAGSFQRANAGGTNIPASQIAKFNIQTNTWSAVSGGPVFVHAMATNGTDLYVGGGFTVVNSNLAANYVAKLDTLTGTWSTLGSGGGNGLNNSVEALALSGNDLYVGGIFTTANVGGSVISASRMAKFNIQTNTWSALPSASGGNGVSNPVFTLLLNGNDLYVGGTFFTADVGGANLLANNVAKYNIQTSTWSKLGTGGGGGVDNTVNALVLNGSDLYVGGAFTKANQNGTTVNTSNLAKYNMQTSTWSALGTGGGNGVNNTVRALALVNGDLYSGGDFAVTNVGGTTVNASFITRFNTASSNWSVLGPDSGNGLNGQVNALAVSGTDIYVGGDFTLAGNTSANRLAKFNTVTNTWSALSGASGGNGVNGTVNALLLKDSDLYVGGTFTTANVGGTTVSVNRLAKFNTTTGAWSTLGTSGGNGVDNTVRTLALIDSDLYVGGEFLNANAGANVAANRIARVNITSGTWSKVGTGSGNGVDNNVRALVVSGTDLYIGGSFLNVNVGASTGANRVVKFNTTTNTWSILGTGNGNGVGTFSGYAVYALAVSGNFLYVGGYFDTVNAGGTNQNANNIAKVNTTTGVWSPLTISFSGGGVIGAGDGIPAEVYALFPSGNDLYVGGKFAFSEYPTSISTNRISKVNIQTGQWSAIPDTNGSNGIMAGASFRNYVNAVAKLGSDLYMGGSFAAVGDNSKPSTSFAHICNRTPTITPGVQLTAVQSTTTPNTLLGSVSDDLSTYSSLQISVSAPTGITFSNFVINTAGNISADMTVSCAAATGSQTFTVQISDGSLMASTNMTVSVIKNEINVNGSTGVAILDGDTTPTVANGADFGTAQVTGGTTTRTFTIQNTNPGALTVSGITLSGANASDFTISGITFPQTINNGGSTTFTVTFDPSASGTRAATINIANNDCDEEVYDFAIQGSGSNVEYTVTTTGGAIIVSDMAGNADTLAITEPSSGTIKFAAAGRSFLINNSSSTTGDTGTLTLSGINSITLNQGNGNDTVNISAFTGTLPNLTINGDAGDDTVNFNGSLTFAANANLDVNLQNDTATPGIDTVNVVGQLTASNAGTIDVRASRNVTVGIGGRLQTQNGNLTVQANQQTTPTSGAFTGVSINGGVIQAIGNGAISISGRGGNSGDNQIGVAVQAGGSVWAFGASPITITGTGGAGANGNAGVSVNGLNTNGTIISAGIGGVNITGTATGATGTDQDGVRFANSTGAQATALTVTSTGQLTIKGTAGNSDATSAGISLVDDTTITCGNNLSTFIADTMDIGTSNVSITSTNAVILTVKTATQGIDVGGADSTTALGLTDSELDRITCSVLRIGDTTNTSFINVSAAITRAAATNFNLLAAPPAGAININSGGSFNTAGGSIVCTSVGTSGLKSAATGVDANMGMTGGTLSFASGSTFNVAINGTTVDTGYQQMNVVGKLNLTGCTLAFNGTTPISTPTTFTIINNDSTDAITGTFSGLPEGATINNFLGTGKTASISYVGGDGNDVTISSPSNVLVITAGGPLVRQQAAAAINSVIATVSDPNQSAGSLTVTALTVPTGISVTNIVNTNGTVTADVSASCLGAPGNNTVALQASNGSFTKQANLTVTVNGSEINLKGNSVSIPDGSTTPNTVNGTDFGTTSAPLSHAFTIENSGNQPLTISGISLSGTDAGDFTVGDITFPATINPGSSKTFTLTFVPGAESARTATVNIMNNDCDESLYDFRVQGEGTGPDYEITTTGGNIVVTDLKGNDDYLVVYEPEPDHIAFIGFGRVLRVNGTPMSEDSGSLPLATITSITVNVGNGFDTVEVDAFTSMLPSLTINGDADDDTVYFYGAVTFAADANLDVNLQNDSATPGSDIVYVFDAVAVTGSGTIDVRASSIVEVDGSLQTENGSLTVEANQQATSAFGNYSGVTVYGAIQSIGNGDVTVKGRGLDSGDDNPGVAIYGIIQGGDSGTVRVTGTGGQDATGVRNRGILLDGGQIISNGANLEVTGTGTDNAKGFNAGVHLASGGQIVAGGTGTVKVTGTGGAADSTNSGSSDGVLLESTSTKIASTNGDVTVIGNSSAPIKDFFSYGIRVGYQGHGTDIASISAGGTGALTLTGTATGATNAGVNVDANGSLTASGGALQVTGTGVVRAGITAISSAVISNPTGSVTLISDGLDFQGTINATTLTLRQKTDGINIYVGANTLNPGISLSEFFLDRYTCSTFNIGDSHSGTLTVSQPITRPALTHVNLAAGGDINFNFGLDTAGGNVTVTPGTGHKVTAAAPVDAGMGATGTLSFANNPTLLLTINSTSGGQYEQLSVTGGVNLTGIGLAFQGTPSIPGTPTLTIVNNDGTDPITGIFTGLPEGATISNFLNSGRNAKISYVGGDGNDAVVTILPLNTAPSITAASGLSRQAGSNASNSTIATVSDTESGAGGVTVTVNGGASATVNGVTVSSIVNTNGTVTANIVADCVSSNASFTLTASDGSLTTNATLNVTVVANTAATPGNYSTANVTVGQGTTVMPSAAPTDNGTILSMTASAPGFTGTLSVDKNTGVVTIGNAGPVGSYTVTVTATDNCNAQSTKTFTLNVNCQTITVTAPGTNTGTAGTAFNQTFTQSGGIGNVTFTTTSTLPTGIALSTGGVLSGTPTQTGTFPITVKATDGNNCMGIVGYTLTINCQTITVTAPTTTSGTAGAAFSQTFTQTGGIGTTTFSTTSTLPNGITLSSAGVLSGTTVQTGNFPITVKATDTNGCFGTVSYTLVITCPMITLSPTTLTPGTIGSSYNQSVAASPAGTYSYAVTSGALPGGLNLNSANGAITGTPTATGSFNFTITATLTGAAMPAAASKQATYVTPMVVMQCSGSQAYTLTINCQTITVTAPAINTGTAGTAFNQTFTQSGGIGTTNFSTNSSLPTGIALAASGVLSGTPTQTGTFPITVKATDANGCFGTVSYTLTINCQTITVTAPTTTSGTAGSSFNQSFTQSGGIGNITFNTTNTLPTGITLSNAGVLSGTPTVTGSFPITVKATDANGCFGTASYTLTINCPTITVTAPTTTSGTAGTAFDQTFTQTGGIGTTTFSTTSTLPTSITLSGTGRLSGMPTQTGTFPITVKATDSNNCTGTVSYTLTINCPTITVTAPVINTGTTGVAFNQTFTQTGGGGNVTFSTTSTLPTGITLSTGGVLSGTPTQTGTFPITVKATDSNNCMGTISYILTISCPTITLSPASPLPDGTTGVAYSTGISASGGTASYTFMVTAGTVPTGLTLNNNGSWSGAPTIANTYNFTVKATDANGCTAEQAYRLTIHLPLPTLGTYPATTVILGSNTNIMPTAAPTTAASLNVSTSTDFNGTFAADPTTGKVYVTNAHPAGTYLVTVKAFNGEGVATTQTFTLTVTTPATCTPVFFNAPLNLSAPAGVNFVAVGDFNRDGKQDFASSSQGTNKVAIRLGNGDGTFGTLGSFNTPNKPVAIIISDFNGDGKPDIATADAIASANVSIFLGNGDGTFGAASNLTAGDSPTALATGDVNGDGKLDMAVANANSNNVSVFLGSGDGTFGAASNIATGGMVAQSIAIGEFNGDTKPDLAIANRDSNNITILLGDGIGGFTAAVNSPIAVNAIHPVSITIGDFNGDAKQDVATVNNGSDNVSVLLGNGNGSFNSAVVFNVGKSPTRVVTGDFNGDGKADMASSNSDATANNVSLLLGNGTGSFAAASNFGTGSLPAAVAVGDFNGDGLQDLVTANSGSADVTVLIRKCNTAPTITAATGVSRARGGVISNSQIATVGDAESGAGGVTVTITSANPANGVTVSNITNTNGMIKADIVAACNATTATFTLQASDGNLTASASLTVSVTPDTIKPTLSCPANITTSTASGSCTKAVNYAVPVAIDNCEGATVVCNPVSGSTFQKGVTTVTCTATDAAGNQNSCSFTVTVIDTQAPQITCPANISVPTAVGQCAAVVTYATPQASDNCPNVGAVVCSPASGTSFAKGVTTVTCTVTDASSNTNSCSFTVTVIDTQAPQITCPANIIRMATKPGDATVVVNFTTPTATDNCGSASVICTPPSGSTFPTGVTTVSCRATDTGGNQNSCSFTVTVFDACVQDDASAGTSIVLNTKTGEYIFCCGGVKYSGTGIMTVRGSTYTLQHNTADRRVQVTMDTATNRATASYQRLGTGAATCTVNDRDIRDNTCPCVTQ